MREAVFALTIERPNRARQWTVRSGVRIAFDRHRGRGVYHCHILDHEDLGMMGVIRAAEGQL